MSDIRKLLDIINETTVAGSVATVAAPMGEMHKRVEETPSEESTKPEVIEYGMWENSALATTSKLKKNRGKSAKVVKSIYGEDVQSEAANPKQQAAIAIAKKEEMGEAKKIPASNKPVDPKDLVVSLKDVPTKKPRGHKQYDPAKEFPGVKAFQKEGVAEGKFVKAAGGVPSDRYGNPKAEKPPKSVSTMTLRQLEKNKRENPGQSPFITQDEKVKKYLGLEEEGVAEGYDDRKTAPGWHSDSVKNPNFNDELSGRRVSPPGERLKSGKLSADERGSQERTKALMKFKKAQGGLTGPKGVLPEQDMAEGTLEESDLILNPASLSKLSRDLVSHEHDRTDHEVEMAKSDLYQAGKNAVKIFELIKNTTEEEGLEGWVQEKIIKANDYLNTIREYLEGKQMESMDGVAPGTKMFTSEEKPGLWANIHAKRKRIKSGSGERMRKPGSKGAPSAQDFKDAAK